jgi:hypothetical protein
MSIETSGAMVAPEIAEYSSLSAGGLLKSAENKLRPYAC